MKSAGRFLFSSLVEYETQKVVQINSWKVGLFFRIIQLTIIIYVLVWVMYIEKGYQAFDTAVSGVTAKVKGIAFANLSDVPSVGMRVWDVADYVVPPAQNSAFFVVTNLVTTPEQKQGICPESGDVYKIECTTDDDCIENEFVMIGSGVKTGKCVWNYQAKKNVCEVYAWCPTEHDVLPIPGEPLLQGVPNFTVLIKNSIEFPRYNVKRRNILSWMSNIYLKTCRYDPNHIENRFCPIFRLGDIVNYSDALNKDVWTYGGMVSIFIEWECDLDRDLKYCVPKYTFRRLDDTEKGATAEGWNFRYAHTYWQNGTMYRTRIKAYGVQFFITVFGRGRKFDALVFTMRLGSGLALLGMATILCDMIALNITRKRNIYRQARVDKLDMRKEGKTKTEPDIPSSDEVVNISMEPFEGKCAENDEGELRKKEF